MAQQIYVWSNGPNGPKFLIPYHLAKEQANSVGLFTPGHFMRFL